MKALQIIQNLRLQSPFLGDAFAKDDSNFAVCEPVGNPISVSVEATSAWYSLVTLSVDENLSTAITEVYNALKKMADTKILGALSDHPTTCIGAKSKKEAYGTWRLEEDGDLFRFHFNTTLNLYPI